MLQQQQIHAIIVAVNRFDRGVKPLLIMEGDKMGLSIKWDITYRCNLKCDHCINGEYLSDSEDEISYEGITNIVDKISQNIKIDYIHFLGGEPLVRKDFVDILLYLDKKGIKFGFNTNGLLFNKGVIEQIGHLKNFDTIILSLEGPNTEINDKIRGKNVFNVLLKRMELIKEYREQHPESSFKLCVNTVLTVLNYKYIADIIALCEQEGADELNLLEFIEEGNGVGKHLSINTQQYFETIKTVADYYTNGSNRVKIVPKFARPLAIKYASQCLGMKFPEIQHACGAGATFLFIDNQGRVSPCDRECHRNSAGYNLNENDFEPMWESERFSKPFAIYNGDKIYQNLSPCNGCEYLCEECFPCYLDINKNVKSEMNQCKLLLNEITKITREGA